MYRILSIKLIFSCISASSGLHIYMNYTYPFTLCAVGFHIIRSLNPCFIWHIWLECLLPGHFEIFDWQCWVLRTQLWLSFYESSFIETCLFRFSWIPFSPELQSTWLKIQSYLSPPYLLSVMLLESNYALFMFSPESNLRITY